MPRKISHNKSSSTMLPPTTPEAQETRNIALAASLAEQQLRDGTASSQVITHYLKLGTMKTQLELEQLRGDIDLKKAKTEALESAKHMEEMYANAIKAMGIYTGASEDDEDEDI